MKGLDGRMMSRICVLKGEKGTGDMSKLHNEEF